MAADPTKLTPGVLDEYAKGTFKYGACGALAIAMHDELGWPIIAITDAHNVFEDGTAGGGSALHWTARAPDGKLVDVDGAHDEADLVEEYMFDADDEEAAAGLSSRADCIEWYVESQGEPVPVSLARSFVAAVLDNAGYGPPSPHLLAIEFTRGVVEALGPQKLEEARRRNDAETTPGVCHTHDFTDPNMLMGEAFEEVVGRPDQVDNEDDAALWSEAWRIAQGARFDLMKLQATLPLKDLRKLDRGELSDYLSAFAIMHGFPDLSSDDLLMRPLLTQEQADWLEAHRDAWEAAEEPEPQSIAL
jgi:hypothetical protein